MGCDAERKKGRQSNQPLCHDTEQTSWYTFYKYQSFLTYNVI